MLFGLAPRILCHSLRRLLWSPLRGYLCLSRWPWARRVRERIYARTRLSSVCARRFANRSLLEHVSDHLISGELEKEPLLAHAFHYFVLGHLSANLG